MEWFNTFKPVASDTWDLLKNEGSVNHSVEGNSRRNPVKMYPDSSDI